MIHNTYIQCSCYRQCCLTCYIFPHHYDLQCAFVRGHSVTNTKKISLHIIDYGIVVIDILSEHIRNEFVFVWENGLYERIREYILIRTHQHREGESTQMLMVLHVEGGRVECICTHYSTVRKWNRWRRNNKLLSYYLCDAISMTKISKFIESLWKAEDICILSRPT